MGARSGLVLLAAFVVAGGCAAGKVEPQRSSASVARSAGDASSSESPAASPVVPVPSIERHAEAAHVQQPAPSAAGARRKQEQAIADVPVCTRKLGTLSIVNGDDPRGWTDRALAPPQKLLKLLVQRSGCFDLVDRGRGLQAAGRERAIGGNLGHQRGANVGRGQIKAADYVMVAEIQGINSNVSGSGVGGLIGGLIGSRPGALAAGIGSKKVEANTVLSVTNVRTTETIATAEGYAARSNLGFGGGAAILGGGLSAIGGGYGDTESGRIATLSFIKAYSKLVTELGAVSPDDRRFAVGRAIRSFIAQRPIALRVSANSKARVIRTLPGGAAVHRTGNANGLWWEVADENDNVGWVLNTGLAAAMDMRSLAPEESLLPWPPPRPSAMSEVTGNFRGGVTLGSYDKQLEALLIRKGYSGLRYFSVPSGFGITTNVERLDSEGRPHRNRWSRKPPPPGGLFDYVRQLIQGDTGRFRVLVFIVSDQEPRPESYRAKQVDLERWQERGKLALSSQTARESSPSLRVWMLAYEFVSSKSKSGDLVADNEGAFPASVHTRFLGFR